MVSTDSPSPESGPPEKAAFVLLCPGDNILVCTRSARAGDMVEIDGRIHRLSVDIMLGHKIARVALRPGEKVLRYGMPIGSMTAAAWPADHVHRHNLASDYIPSHGRDAIQVEGRR